MAMKRCLDILCVYLIPSIVCFWKLKVYMVKKYGNTNTCMHIMMNTHLLILGLQNDIEMSSMSVIEVNSIFTWLPEIAIMKPFIIKPCIDVPSKHFGCCHDFHFHNPDR